MDKAPEAKVEATPEARKARQRQVFIKQRLQELKEERASLTAERKQNKAVLVSAKAKA